MKDYQFTKVTNLNCSSVYIIMSLKICFNLSKQCKVVFHLGLHCLPKYQFVDIQNEKGSDKNIFCLVTSV